MMTGEHKHVLILGQLQQARAQHWSPSQIEWLVPFLIQRGADRFVLCSRVQLTKIGHG